MTGMAFQSWKRTHGLFFSFSSFHKLLLASSGKEFAKPTGILPTIQEIKKARKEAINRLRLSFLDTVDDGMELEKEFAAEMDVDPPEDTSVAGNQPDSSAQADMDVFQFDLPANKDLAIYLVGNADCYFISLQHGTS